MPALTKRLYSALTGADDDTLAERPNEPRNGLVHAISVSMTKVSDGLIDPKLVLAWLLGAVGAPGVFVGALVPIREAGALLPQLALTRWVDRMQAYKVAWSLGSAGQGAAALAIALAAWTLEGLAAGVAILAALAVLSVARALCSISYKSALARSIGKSRRGAVSGFAATIGAASVLGFGGLLAVGWIPLSVQAIAVAIAVAGAFWLLASVLFLRLKEDSDNGDEPDEEESLLQAAVHSLKEDSELRLFLTTRALLTATALAPPFLVMLSGSGQDRGLGQLGPLVLASAAASIASAYVWGRISDRSSRLTLALSAIVAAGVLGATAAVGFMLGDLGGIVGSIAAIFLAQIAYEGVRSGRKIHLTDMTTDDERTRYTAISNTLIGIVLIAGGGLGYLADIFGPAIVLAVLASLCLVAAPVALSLKDVQQSGASSG